MGIRARNRSIETFNLSMLDVLTGALGGFLLIMLVLMRFHEPNLRRENDRLHEQIVAAQAQVNEAKRQRDDDRARLEDAQRQRDEALAKVSVSEEQQLGMALRETEIVFVVDTSGSMVNQQATPPNRNEDRLSQVTSGIKMLVAMMSSAYQIDIVSFPSANGSYQPMFGQLRPVTDSLKYDVYRRLQTLRADGATPTGEAMTAVLGQPQYAAARSVVLLSDGEPCRSVGQNCAALDRSELAQLVDRLTQLNAGKKSIYTIGVGAMFRDERSSGEDAVEFLRNLAARNDGRFIGF